MTLCLWKNTAGKVAHPVPMSRATPTSCLVPTACSIRLAFNRVQEPPFVPLDLRFAHAPDVLSPSSDVA